MPVRTTITEDTILSGAFGPNNAVAQGVIWVVKPLLPIPDDSTTQSDAFIALNKDKSANVAVWTDIKYAEDPVGDLRFKPAVPYNYPLSIFDATKRPFIPFQRYSEELDSNGRPEFGTPTVGAYDWAGMGTRESERCLSLNIFGPVGLNDRPVIIQIHGGGWGVYHAMGPQQLGHRLAAHKGCIVVNIEYRLSIFGHFPHPELIADGEPSVAYTDIKLAIEWVFNNISAFGGDPNKICICGTSAGGAAVMQLLEDDDVQSYINSAWIDSGGGGAPYLDASYYTERMRTFEKAIRGMAPMLISMHPDYNTVHDAIEAQGFGWAMQHAITAKDLQGLADARDVLTEPSVKSAMAGTGSVQTTFVPTDNVYPFKRSTYTSGVEAAKAGKFRKPFVVSYAECEALNLLGSDYTTIRNTLLALPMSTLNGWAQRLGYADYADWKTSAWWPTSDLGLLTSAQFKTSTDPLAVDCENRRVLYSLAVFGYWAWRIARAAAETGSAKSYFEVYNFSANSIWAGHSQALALMFGNLEWLVAGGGNRTGVEVPGLYVNNRMDAFYASEIKMQAIAALAATGDVNGEYNYAGFDLFSDPATHPADGGMFEAVWTEYSGPTQGASANTSGMAANTQGGYANVFGKYFDPIDNLNAGTFGGGGDIVSGLDSHRDARLSYGELLGDAWFEIMGKLEA